jgi:hypothetical protein
MVVAVALGLAVLALGFPASASPGAPTPVGHEWSQVENHGTSGAPIDTYWLGTPGTQALELRVNNARVLRLEPKTDTPNVIGGYSGNSVTSGVEGATIGGGGFPPSLYTGPNKVTDLLGTVGGGLTNTAGDNDAYLDDAGMATVGGGGANTASGGFSTIGGGYYSGAPGEYATVAGGDGNHANGDYATVGGGYSNGANSDYATVGGGNDNTASGDTSTVGGGGSNLADGASATVGGGEDNTASGTAATVSGGDNSLALGQYATVPGGNNNFAGGDYSFASGRRVRVDASHDGSFLFADQSNFNFNSAAANEFAVRSTGGARFVSGIDGAGLPNAGVTLAAGGNAWAAISDRNVKANFTSVDGRDVLERLASVPIETWNLKSQDASIRHMGPMAQDFYAAFGLGESETAITTVDADGVALAAIQGLYALAQEQGARIQALEEENASLNQRLDSLEARVSAVEGGTGADALVTRASSSGFPGTWVVLGGGLALVLVGLVLAQRRLAGGRS